MFINIYKYCVKCILTICLFLSTSVVLAVPINGIGVRGTDHLSARLDHLVRSNLTRDNIVTVIFEVDDLSNSSRALISSHAGKVRFQKNRAYEISIPAEKLQQLLKKLPSKIRARLPYPHQAVAVTSQGVEIMGAADMQALSHGGAGVKIGIIDLGFSNYVAAQSTGDLPAGISIIDYTGTGTGGTSHGTSVAEIVHDMAPDAELYLAKVNTSVQLDVAMNEMLSAGVNIINHSVAWFGAAFYDGSGSICQITDAAQSAGMLWVNAMGNSRNAHYLNAFTDLDGDLKHDFLEVATQNYNTISLTANNTISLILNWDAYPITRDIDYNLYLYDHVPTIGSIPVAFSENPQRRPYNNPPLEIISFTPTTSGTYYLVVTKTSGNTVNIPFSLFSTSSSFSVRTTASSLPQPADCNSSLSVGAVNLSDGVESFSSEGPTTDGRNKPELSATNRTITSQTSSFAGTSGAAPHVAGAAALLLSQNSALSTSQLTSLLILNSKDVSTGGYDYRTGEGRVSLDADLDIINHDDDNCPLIFNPEQTDMDNDGFGNVCDDDIDGDGLSNQIEISIGSDPENIDTDFDGLSDGDEINIYASNPLVQDTDYDGLIDGDEINIFGTNVLTSNRGDLAPKGAPDDVIDIVDLMMMYRYLENIESPDATSLLLLDVNSDGSINISDALYLTRMLGY